MEDVLKILEAQQLRISNEIKLETERIYNAKADLESRKADLAKAEETVRTRELTMAQLKARLMEFDAAYKLIQKASMVDQDFLKEVNSSDVV